MSRSASPHSSMRAPPYYPQIEGLRALAAVLVAVYHIWMDRVSGGVDVFFVVSGFLITTTLLRQIENSGRVPFLRFYTNILARLVPAAMVVLAVTLFGSIFFIPATQWHDTARQFIASAFYYQNWQLALSSVDYLAQENLPSPVQHYWAMSIQGQFYLIWPFLFLLPIFLVKVGILSLRVGLAVLFSSLFLGSFAYSVYSTHWGEQAWAYFDTGARIWEFTIGGLLALMLPFLRLPPYLRGFAGWLGVIGIVSAGLVIQGAAMFPGYAALWPTLSAVLVMIAGASGPWWGAQRIMTAPPIVALGGMAYGIYLWHWPLLIFYRTKIPDEQPSLGAGLLIIIGSVVLAWATVRWVEKPSRRRHSNSEWRTVGMAAQFVVPLVTLVLLWLVFIERDSSARVFDPTTHPGAEALVNQDSSFPRDIDPWPSLLHIRRDLPLSYHDHCHMSQQAGPEPRLCLYGETEDFDRTLAVVGGSHSAHWLPALEMVAHEQRWRIVYSTRSACRFSTEISSRVNCNKYNELLLKALLELDPDLVFLTANVRREGMPRAGYIEKWNALHDAGIRVFAVRDTPTMPFEPPDCLAKRTDGRESCTASREEALGILFDASMVPPNVHVSDLTELFCETSSCPSVIGNIIVYRDAHHISATYARTLAPFLGAKIGAVMNEAPPKSQSGLAGRTRFEGILFCGAGRRASESPHVLFFEDDMVRLGRGDFVSRERAFEFWEGRVQESGAVVLVGRYSRPGSEDGSVGSISGAVAMSGQIKDRKLYLEGTRGDRRCSFVGGMR